MLSVSEKILVKALSDKVLAQYVNAIKTKKVTKFGAVNSSGRLAASGEIVLTDNGFQLHANEYITGLIEGVKPGETTATLGDIQNWIQEKPLSSSIPINSLAAIILRKQRKEGNMVWRTHKGADSGLLADVANDSTINQFVSLLASQSVEELTKDIVKSFEVKL